jgi:hypothetical protein
MRLAHLADALREAAAAHHAFEQETGKPDADWHTWYARHMLWAHPELHDATHPVQEAAPWSPWGPANGGFY